MDGAGNLSSQPRAVDVQSLRPVYCTGRTWDCGAVFLMAKLMLKFVTDREIYDEVICGAIPTARRLLWLATADLKDLHMEKRGKMVPFLEILSDLAARNVEIRLLHAKEPGPVFRRDFDRYRNLSKGLERMLCPRVHLKCAIVDGAFAYSGSANLTGAGVGAKSVRRRNFESGIVTTDPALVGRIMEQFDGIWRGSHCRDCDRKEYCDEHAAILPARKGAPR
jgi:phosphatidylserine/phosphatidylglycerophosphate/cardiolipin synthase-like enzyme